MFVGNENKKPGGEADQISFRGRQVLNNLVWIKSTTHTWLPLSFNFANITPTTGVYIVWHGGLIPRTVRVGQGDIASRLSAHRRDSEITIYARFGLFVTWAAVPAPHLDGVERFLADRLFPLLGDWHPAKTPVRVNLPWAA
jgi:hypothetical protein